ncbi:MAG TPA: hypothetical protein VGM17_13115 [Rhizomicrobium sp.]|jgi:hypothetical protein
MRRPEFHTGHSFLFCHQEFHPDGVVFKFSRGGPLHVVLRNSRSSRSHDVPLLSSALRRNCSASAASLLTDQSVSCDNKFAGRSGRKSGVDPVADFEKPLPLTSKQNSDLRPQLFSRTLRARENDWATEAAPSIEHNL